MAAETTPETGQHLVQLLAEALPYITQLAGKTVVVKIGGSTLGQHDTTLQDVVTLKNLHINVVLVHGGGSLITDWLNRIGKEARFIDGLRVTDAETMDIVTMTLAGKVNKDLVATLQALGGRAVGLSGVDGGLLRADPLNPLLGAVGLVRQVDLTPVRLLSEAGYIPVIAPIALGENGQLLNLNADTAAAEIAIALGAEKLIFLTDVPGICDAEGRLLSQLTASQTRALIAQRVIRGGMIPKAEACLRAIGAVNRTHIIDGRVPHALIRELFTTIGVGTMIVPD